MKASSNSPEPFRTSGKILIRRTFGLAMALSVLVSGCSFGNLDLTQRECPCIEGWRCDTTRNVCIPQDVVIPDAGVDARLPDANQDATVDAIVDAIRDAPDAATDVILDATVDMTLDADATIDATPTNPCSMTNPPIICEFFEDNALTTWTRYADLTGTEVVMDRPFSGSAALRVTTTTAGGASGLAQNIPKITGGEFYVRVRIRPTQNTALSFFSTYENVTPFNGIALSVVNAKLELYLSETGEGVLTNNTVLLDQWNCVLLHATVSETGTVRVSLNNGPVVVRNTDTQPAGGYDGIDTGITYTPPDVSAATIDIDELIVSREPLSCD